MKSDRKLCQPKSTEHQSAGHDYLPTIVSTFDGVKWSFLHRISDSFSADWVLNILGRSLDEISDRTITDNLAILLSEFVNPIQTAKR